MKNKKLIIAFFAIFYLVALFTRIYWVNQKEGLYVDETLTVIISCYNDYAYLKNYELNKFQSGKEIKEMTLCDDATVKGAIKDIWHLYKDNRDHPHTNFYYSFFRLAVIGLQTGDIKPIIIRGAILNLFFWTVSFIFFFLLIKLIFKDDFISLVATFCTFMSTATISNSLFLRPYQLQETIFIIFAYAIFKIIDKTKIIQSENKSFININFKILIPISIITALTLLTGYYAIIYILIFGLFICWYNKIDNNFDKQSIKREIIFYSIVLLLGFLVAQSLYTRYYTGYLIGRAIGTLEIVAGNLEGVSGGNVFYNLYISFLAPFKILFKHYFNIYVCGALAALLLYCLFTVKEKSKILKTITVKNIGLFVIALAFIFIIMFVAPYKILRYIMPVIPFLIILFIVLLQLIKKNNYKIFFAILMLIAFTFSAFNEENIEYLMKNKSAEFKFINEPNLPVLIINVDEHWRYVDMVPYFADDQKYIFAESIESGINLLKDYAEFTVVIEEDLVSENRAKSINSNAELKVLSEYNAGYNPDVNLFYFRCFRIKREE